MHHEFDTGKGACSPTSGQVQAQAARSVNLLNAIESTVTRLHSDAEIVTTLVREFRKFLEQLAAAAPIAPLDPEGRASELFEQGAAITVRIYNRAIAQREAARRAEELTGEDGVEEAYDAFIAAFADFHNVLEDIRDTMSTIDAELSPPAGGASDHEALIASLRA